ncbi:unnamed protein product [Didymodactylos carnosus]|uniref:RING-type domain-containing protein n=1 Tax=Didymodactylos carnosus TaxID=1234261 RepID=A0A8S2CMB9_9BILA|nr:unnamed protein product [Didymodactylos carnosus]CAF3526633.1 unnamed protein product [Didymodactylos carnosus]
MNFSILPCGHTFCIDCIRHEMLESTTMACPMCPTKHTIVNPELLSQNVALMQLLHIRKIDIVQNTQCKICNALPSITSCAHCTRSACVTCLETHRQEVIQEITREIGDLVKQSQDLKRDLNDSSGDFRDRCDEAFQTTNKRFDEMQKNLKMVNERLCQKIQEFHDRRQSDLARCVSRLHTEIQAIDKFVDDTRYLLTDVNVQTEVLLRVKQQCIEPKKRLPALAKDLIESTPTIEFIASTCQIGDELVGSLFLDRPLTVAHGASTAAGDGPSGLTVNGDGHLVIAEVENNRLQILTRDFNHVRTIIGFREPRDVAVSRDKRYLITDNHKLIILDEDFRKIDVIGSNKPGRARNAFNGPTGITIDEQDEITVCDTHNDRLVVFSKDYKWNRDFTTGPESSPRYVCSYNDTLYVTCAGKSCVIMLTKQGEALQVIPDSSLGLRIDAPRVIQYVRDLLFVVSSHAKSIFVFTPDGEYRGELRHEMFNRPVGILFVDDSLYVTDTEKHSIFHFSGVLQ